MVEPAAFGASVLFGSHTNNFRDAVDALLRLNAAQCVNSPNQLTQAILEDLRDPDAAAARGDAARKFVLSQQGAADRTLAEIERLLPSPSLANPRFHAA